MCHPFGKLRASSEAQPKDLANGKEILRFAQNDSFAVTLGTPNLWGSPHRSSMIGINVRTKKAELKKFGLLWDTIQM